jgi:hypothetical protein
MKDFSMKTKLLWIVIGAITIVSIIIAIESIYRIDFLQN